MSTSHTITSRDTGDATCLYLDKSNRPFATLYHSNFAGGFQEANQFGRLLAAAPDLLAALKNLVALHPEILRAHCPKPIGAPGSVARVEQDFAKQLEAEARAAIAKAEGRS